jgi:hypothetical protein
MYFDHFSASRANAPRIGTRLCMVCVQFSAVHSQPWSGKKKFISAGASASGVIWNRMRTPSTTSSSPVSVISSVGAMRPGGQNGIALPNPQSTCWRGPGGSRGPNWYAARRVIAKPAITFSAMVSRRKCSGAITRQRPASTSACVVTPSTPPKWSVCECV